MHKKSTCLLLVTTLALSGCADRGPKETGGTILGGVAGAVLGSQFGKGKGQLIGTAIGAMAGGYLGGMLGHKMDENDRAMAQRTMQNTLEHAPDHQGQQWKNPNNNHSGNFTVTRTQEMPAQHLVCRDYVHTVIIDGQQEKVHGRACRDMRDRRGAWNVQS